MDRDAWMREYRYLLTAYGKSANADQAGVYFAALGAYPVSAVASAVAGAIKESRGWPSAADLAERSRGFLASHSAPRGVCDVCHGDGWTQHRCTPQMPCGATHGSTMSMPIYRPGSTSWTPPAPYEHDYARPCYQCKPREGAA